MAQSNLTQQFNPKFRTIREIHDGFDKKTISPTELVGEYLNVAKSSRTNAFLTLCEERALKQAKAAEVVLSKEGKTPREKMPLFGIPMGIKDNITVDGIRTTCGSKILENYVPPYTATAVQRLEEAGAVCVGKLNLDEFAMGGSNENSAFGPVKHPSHPDRVPGGSSGGSAAAVGEGACVAALGSDTGGSIRLPASYCGIVGMKPTYGRISRYGLVAFASSLDQIGPMTRSVEDAAIVLDAMSGHDPLDSTSAPKPRTQTVNALKTPVNWKGLRVGVPKEYFTGGLAPAVEKAVEASLKFFETQGVKLVPISLPHSEFAVAIYYIVAVSEASSNLARYDGVRFGVRPAGASEAKDLKEFYEKVRSNFGPEVKRRIILGTFALSAGYSDAYYKRACQVRRKIKDDFDRAFEKVDLIAGPVSPTTAFKLGEKVSDPLEMYLNDLFTIPANLAGIPAMSLPCGKDSADLPIGLHLMAPAFGEDRLFSVGHGFSTGFEAGRF
jgi:aspartyl-tRNA(Asn)/glutamyl-tRNA(Gln) amidotransferase subunit A